MGNRKESAAKTELDPESKQYPWGVMKAFNEIKDRMDRMDKRMNRGFKETRRSVNKSEEQLRIQIKESEGRLQSQINEMHRPIGWLQKVALMATGGFFVLLMTFAAIAWIIEQFGLQLGAGSNSPSIEHTTSHTSSSGIENEQ